MGMFDDLIVRYPLPGNPPEFTRAPDHHFQTKDLDCTMSVYEIDAEGHLVRHGCYGLVKFEGDLEFYSSNIQASTYGVQFTRDGEDAEWVRYIAQFNGGRLETIRVVDHTRQPALPLGARNDQDLRPPIPNPRPAESLLNRTLYLLPPGTATEKGHSVQVLAEGKHEWVVQLPNEHLQVVDRRSRDHSLFDSEADAARIRAAWEDRQLAQRARLERLLKEREEFRKAQAPDPPPEADPPI